MAISIYKPFRSIAMKRRNCAWSFTLIELLVVISIIALLISILLPALQKVKRQVKVIECLSNLKSIGTGIAAYVSEYNGQYPTPSCGNGTWVKSSVVDNRQNLVDIAGGSPGFWFCSLYLGGGISPRIALPPGKAFFEERGKPVPEFADHFQNPGTNHPAGTGYALPFIMIDPDVHGGQYGSGTSWDWRKSGNPDGPWTPGDATAPAVVDYNAHSEGRVIVNRLNENFEEANSLWGDGHGVTRSTMQNRLIRVAPFALHRY